MALAFVAGIGTASRRARLTGISAEAVLDIGPWLIIGSLLGARSLYVISYWESDFASRPWSEMFMIHHGGLVFYGGLIGAIISGIIFIKRRKLPLWAMGDILAPSIALGYVFGRIGCLMNGCCYGRACQLPWAISYPGGHETHPPGSAAIPVHPTQIYDSLLNLALYLGLAWLYRRKKFDGQVFATYLIGYAITRSSVEFFRGDYPHLYAGWITPAHLVSALIFAAGLALWFLLPRKVTPRV